MSCIGTRLFFNLIVRALIKTKKENEIVFDALMYVAGRECVMVWQAVMTYIFWELTTTCYKVISYNN